MSSMLRQHHIKLADLSTCLRGFDPAKTESAEDWSRIESATFEPGMLLFCLERVSAPQGLAFGKKEEGSESYRVRDLCVVVGRDNGRPLVVNITASAYELRFLEVLLLEKARKAILDSKEFLYVSAQPSVPINDAKIREIEQLGAVYAQGGSRRTLVVDVNGPQEPAMALLGSLGVKLQTGTIGKQVLDIGSVCHMLFTPETRQDDRNKQIVKQSFAPIASTMHSSSGEASLAQAAAPAPATAPATEQAEAGAPDLRFSFERTEISTDSSTWQPQQSGQGYTFPAQAPAAEAADAPAQAAAQAAPQISGVDPYRNLNQQESARLDSNLLKEFAAAAEQNRASKQSMPAAQAPAPPPAAEPDFKAAPSWQTADATSSVAGGSLSENAAPQQPAYAQATPGSNGGNTADLDSPSGKSGSLFERLSQQFSKVMHPEAQPMQQTAAAVAPPPEFANNPFAQQTPAFDYQEPQFTPNPAAPPPVPAEPFFNQTPDVYSFNTEVAPEPSPQFNSGDSYNPAQTYGGASASTSYGGMATGGASLDPFAPPQPAVSEFSPTPLSTANSGSSGIGSSDALPAVPQASQSFSSLPAVPQSSFPGDAASPAPQYNSGDSQAGISPAVSSPAAPAQADAGEFQHAMPQPTASGEPFAVPQKPLYSGESFDAVPQPPAAEPLAPSPSLTQSFAGTSLAAVPQPNKPSSSGTFPAVPSPLASGDSHKPSPFSVQALSSASDLKPVPQSPLMTPAPASSATASDVNAPAVAEVASTEPAVPAQASLTASVADASAVEETVAAEPPQSTVAEPVVETAAPEASPAVPEEAPKEIAAMPSSVFQEPKLVMSEMATLMNRLEQQVGKAGKKLNARAEEIRQRLNASVAQMVSSAFEVEKNSQNSISALTSKQTQRLDDVSEEVRLSVSDVASNGRYTIKQLLQSNQLQVEDEKTALYEGLKNVCQQFRVDTETLTKTSQASLNKLVIDRTTQLEELVNIISERLNGTSEGYTDKLKGRFDRFKDRMQEEAASVVRSLERNVRSMTEEIDGSWDRASDKLKSNKAEFELTINHTVRTSQLNISSTTRRILSETLIPKLRERKANLRNISNELGRRFAVESDRQANGQLLGLESSLGAARQQLQTLVEECISSIDTVGRAQQASLEEIFKETSAYAEKATLEIVSILQKSEIAIRETEFACKSLAESSSLESDAELMEVRNTANGRVQQLRTHANQELNSAIESGCARLEQLSQRVQMDLSNSRLENTQVIRDAAEQGLSRLREAIQEALSAIQASRDKYME